MSDRTHGPRTRPSSATSSASRSTPAPRRVYNPRSALGKRRRTSRPTWPISAGAFTSRTASRATRRSARRRGRRPRISAARTCRSGWQPIRPASSPTETRTSSTTSGRRRATTAPSSRTISAPTLDSYNHPNAAIEPRIPGIFQYYSIAEDELVKGVAGQYKLGAGDGRRNRRRLGKDHRPDRAGESDKALQGLARHVATTGGVRPRAPLFLPELPGTGAQNPASKPAIQPRTTMSQGDLLHVVTADDISAGRQRFGHAIVWGSALLLAAVAASADRGSHRNRGFRLPDLAADALRLHSLGHLPVLEPGADPRRAWQAHAIRAACRSFRRLADGVPAPVRPHHRFLELEPVLAARAAVQRPRQYQADVERPVLLERARQHGLVLPGDPRRIRRRLRPRAAAQRGNPRAQVLPRGIPAAADAFARRRELDDRQVDAGAALRPDRPLRPLAGLGQPVLLRLARDRQIHHHAARRVDIHPLHDDHDPRRPAGHPEGIDGGGQASTAPARGRASGKSPSR